MFPEPAPKSRFGSAPAAGPVCLESVASADHLFSNTLIVPASVGTVSRQMRSRAFTRIKIAPMATGAVLCKPRRERK
jgi:hypothetical protein